MNIELTKKEVKLLVNLSEYFLNGGRDGDFYPDWINGWTDEEIKDLNEYCIKVNNDEDEEDQDFRCWPTSSILSILLTKLSDAVVVDAIGKDSFSKISIRQGLAVAKSTSCLTLDEIPNSLNNETDKSTNSQGLLKPQDLLKQVHDLVNGRIDALLFAEFLGVKAKDMANLLNISTTGLRGNPTSDKLRPILNRLYIVIDKLLHIFDCSVSEVKLWLNAPNSYLKYETPLNCIFATNNLERVEKLIDAMENEE